VESSFECYNKHSGPIKCWEVLKLAAQPVASRVMLSSIGFVGWSVRDVKFYCLLCSVV
jgi:hypothetical protein